MLKKLIFLMGIITIFASSIFAMPYVDAQTENDDAIKKSQQLGHKASLLQAEIDANMVKLKELALVEDDLNTKIAQINLELELSNKEIEITTVKIDELDLSLVNTQADLDYQRSLLRANIRALYKKGDASDLELLAGSDSFSTYVNDQAYLQKIKDGIQLSAISVIRTKKDIETQRFTQKNLYKKQEAQRKMIVIRQADLAKLLADTKGDQAKYLQLIFDLHAQFDNADSSLADLFRTQKFVSLGKVKAGEQVGLVGSSGLSTGPHTHFAVFMGNKFVDPLGADKKIINNYLWPLPSSDESNITQLYGCTDFELEPTSTSCPGGHFHNGLDIAGSYGDPVISVADGDIVFRGPSGAYGFVVIVDHGGGTFTYYPHLMAP